MEEKDKELDVEQQCSSRSSSFLSINRGKNKNLLDVDRYSTKRESVISIASINNHDQIKLYKFRWYILITECILNLSNSIMFSSYAAVANYTDDYYGQSTTDYLSMVFLGVSVPSVIIAICLAQKVGLRMLIISSAFLNASGTGIRVLSNIDGLSAESRLALVILGNAFGAVANPGTLFLNTKIAATWFPVSQRAIATSLLSVATPLGMLIASPMATAIVKQSSDLMWLNLATFVPCALAFLMTLVIRRSTPPTPPSQSSNLEPMSTFQGIKACLTDRSYVTLMICLGIELGLFNTLYTMIAQILCTRGYDDSFAALCVLLLIGGGLIGSTIAAIIVDKTKMFEEVTKICLAATALSSIVFAEMAIMPNEHAVIAVAMLLYGTFGLAYYAVAMETSAEITYPAAETTSSGFLGVAGQLCGTIFIAVWNKLSRPLPDYYANMQKCTLPGQSADKTSEFTHDMTIPIYLFHILGTLSAVVLILFFKPKYRRVLEELRILVENDRQHRTLSFLNDPHLQPLIVLTNDHEKLRTISILQHENEKQRSGSVLQKENEKQRNGSVLQKETEKQRTDSLLRSVLQKEAGKHLNGSVLQIEKQRTSSFVLKVEKY